MIGVRVECDAAGCGRHFEVGEPELMCGAGPRVSVPAGRCATVVFSAPYAILPPDWTAETTTPGGVLVFCADHSAPDQAAERSAAAHPVEA